MTRRGIGLICMGVLLVLPVEVSAGYIYGEGYGTYGSYQQVYTYPTYQTQSSYIYPQYSYEYPSYTYPYFDDAEISLDKPKRGDNFETGDRVTIKWKSDDAPRNSSVRLDLYTSRSRYVGTIAVVSERNDDYRWEIPDGREFCTYMYPNDLCGMYLSGDYYIRATLLAPRGYILDTDQSGVFEIEQDHRRTRSSYCRDWGYRCR